MAAKFWFVRPTQSKSEPDNESELLPIYKFLRNFRKLQPPENDKNNKEAVGLAGLELHQDFEVHIISGSFCLDLGKRYYEIKTGKDRRLFSAMEDHSICCCFQQDYSNLVVTDLNNAKIFEVQKVELSGYLSTKLNFEIFHPCGGAKIGEISRIENFMEKPKYEINDAHDGPLFTFSIHSEKDLIRHPNFVMGKKGKTAFLQQIGESYQLKIYHLCSIEEKALLLSLVMILDLVKRNG